jgi:alkylation response protein AidB-like acyl-CoA dehydrogenase
MDFTLTEDQVRIQEAARKFATENLRPLARELEASAEPVPAEWLAKYAELGFLGVNLPEEHGGAGLSHLDALLVLEEFAKISSAVAMPVFEASFGPVLAIERFGSEPLKRSVLPRVCAGELIVAVSMSEPDAGTALTDLRTTATVQNGSVSIKGQKRWCSGGGHSGGYLVYCRMSDAPGAKGIGAVYVERQTEGLTFGKSEPLMGFRGIPSADIYFDNVTVPQDNVVVAAGGFRKLMDAFDLERCGNSTMSLGAASSAFEFVLDYVQERKQFGKPIVDFQAVQLKLADMAMKVEASRLLLYRAVSNAGRGLPTIRESSIAKCFANEMVRDVCGTAMQLLGGYGYSKAFDLEQKFRDGWGWGIAGGTIDIQKINIASALVGKRFDQRR